MSVEAVHTVRDCVLRELGSGSTDVMMVDVNHAELGLKLHSLGEQGDQLVERFLCVLHLRVVDEDDAMCILLNRCPALLILEVT